MAEPSGDIAKGQSLEAEVYDRPKPFGLTATVSRCFRANKLGPVLLTFSYSYDSCVSTAVNTDSSGVTSAPITFPANAFGADFWSGICVSARGVVS